MIGKINLYPNPVKDFLFINGIADIIDLNSIEIVSAVGKSVLKIEIAKEEINVSKLAPGFYFLNITHRKEIESIKFIKR
ncbi:MAG: T9SS type A sorting domain-containing protein [Crocinitomicaceae bacterium]